MRTFACMVMAAVVALSTGGGHLTNAQGMPSTTRLYADAGCASPQGWTEIRLPEAVNPNVRRRPLEWPDSIASSFSMPGQIYVGGITGAYVSSDCGGMWHSFSVEHYADDVGRHTGQSMIAADVSETLYVWSHLNPLAISQDGGATWNVARSSAPDGTNLGALYLTVSTVSASGGGVVYATSHHLREWRNPPAVGTWRSTDSGRSWALIDEVPILPLKEAQPNYRVVAVHPQDANTLVALSMSGAPLVSSDGAATFRPIDPSRLPGLADDESIFDVAFGSGGDRMWLRTSVQRVFETRDDGASWRQIPGPNDGEPIVFIAANPFAPDSFFALARSPGQQRIWIYRENAESAE